MLPESVDPKDVSDASASVDSNCKTTDENDDVNDKTKK